MEILDFILIVLFIVLAIIIYFKFNSKNYSEKSPSLKKEEIYKKYENELLNIISEYENNQEQLKIEKINFLKKVSYELHNNIFFDEDEAKALIKKLASL